ncbi:MAG TPA: aldo/keto reductase [Dehalococcoidia bacterium]|jgi:aryl-alcohol dehydrogenase-like predicted oxidoreductase|nr:aldo/keto reductase [Chloroflexota bacterium]MDP5877577.1 aldo/keto reductase [Dehalococcoidia bacterium]MDP6272396.1 aldo/keto reductase [Dehalococcoidia bacterium]MDP7159742.1 aldo/keto reductase [Dehalococcoidia bacterium]MDP7212798.1 aldo/keto reductase [Dehalococcoidia bacterium]|tara:strand:- start:1429 stop:2421 length:993 start_codon:yes stop_codon:yes gene_type:complete
MKYRRLGSSGLLVSTIGLGTNNFGEMLGRMDYESAKATLDACRDNGINFIDTSDSYSGGISEDFIGRAVKDYRKDVIIGTKAGMPWAGGPNRDGLSAAHLKYSIDESLQRLQTDYIDLYQMHIVDPLTPIEETMRALDDIVSAGKVRYVGCSNFMAWEMVEAIQISRQHGWVEFVSNQPQYSMLVRDVETELIHSSAKYSTGILPYFPLASGFLTGKYKRGAALEADTRLAKAQPMADTHLTDTNFDVLEALESFAGEHGHTMVELAFAWLLAHPEVSSVIAGATRIEQIEQNAAATEWELTAEEMSELDAILPGTPGAGVGNLPRRRGL